METGRRKVKINYIDFWSDLDKENFLFTRILRKKYDVEISSHPDYVFCSYFGNKHFKYRDCVKIAFLGENLVPDFNLYDYAMGFHNIIFDDRYLRYPLYALYEPMIKPALLKHTHPDNAYQSKKGFCNYVISNPNAAPERDRMIALLNSYQKVDSGGRYRNNVGGPVTDKMAFAKQYRFTMAFENSSTKGYTTEKILEAFAASTIPIYWGNPEVAKEFNPEAFVNCHEYDSLEDVLTEVRQINEDEKRLLGMLKAPILKDDSLAKKYFDDSYLEAFLYPIFEKDAKDVKRRNMVYIGMDYQNKLRKAYRAKATMDVIDKPIHLIKKTAKQRKSSRINGK